MSSKTLPDWFHPACQEVEAALAAGRLAHGILIHEDRGAGGLALARWIAQRANCRNANRAPCGECQECQWIAADQHPDVRFVWIDVEDSAALVDQVDVENFPTVLIGKGEHPRFFGVITPQPEVLLRLIAAHRERAAVSGSVAAEVSDLLRRLQAFAG